MRVKNSAASTTYATARQLLHKCVGEENAPPDTILRMPSNTYAGASTYETHRTGRDGGKHQAGNVLRYGKRRREDIQEIARPDVFKKRHRHALHDADKEIP